jgi:hypothetical protein
VGSAIVPISMLNGDASEIKVHKPIAYDIDASAASDEAEVVRRDRHRGVLGVRTHQTDTLPSFSVTARVNSCVRFTCPSLAATASRCAREPYLTQN